jgi:hypothetical protein
VFIEHSVLLPVLVQDRSAEGGIVVDPEGQILQVEAPKESEKSPIPQYSQVDDPLFAANEPGGHIVHSDHPSSLE